MLHRLVRVWRRRNDTTYALPMGIARRGKPTPAVTPPPDLENYRGLWVAVKAGKVIAAAETPQKLVYEMSKLSVADRRDAVMQKAHKPSAGILIGMG